MVIAYLVAETYSSNPDWNGDCDYCIIPIYENTLALWKRRMHHIEYMRKNDPEFADMMSLNFMDYSPSYVERTDELEEFLWGDFDSPTSYFTLVMGEKVRELEKLIEGKEQRIANAVLCVAKDWVSHECWVKHTDVMIHTPALYDNYFQMAVETLAIEDKNEEFLIVTLQE